MRRAAVAVCLAAVLLVGLVVALLAPAFARGGNRCPSATGVPVDNRDWDTGNSHLGAWGEGGAYRVRVCRVPQSTAAGWTSCVDRDWVAVPLDQVLDQVNYGPAVVWLYNDNGRVAVRCFLPGVAKYDVRP